MSLKFVRVALVSVVIAVLSGCSESPLRLPTASSKTEGLSTSPEIEPVHEPTALMAAIGQVRNAEQINQRIGQLFEKVLPTLDKTRELVDRHADLPDRTRLPFKQDKQSNSAEINELLDRAIEMLGVSEVSETREQIRLTEAAIRNSHGKIADYRRQRVSAPNAEDQTRLEKANPFALSKETLDERIANELAAIEESETELIQIKKSFAQELTKIGLKVDEEGVESLLSSVSGDDIVSMAIVFDNIKHLTTQLQSLTEESGEALDVSKRYYGMYVVMIQVMDRIQKTFVRDINEEHIPKLEAFARQAEQNKKQAETLIANKGGDEQTLRSNIASNELTRQTAQLYTEYLQQNAQLIARENKGAQKNLATAMNTYNTVKLSSDVAALMNTGRKNFDTLMRLQVPALREFGNEAIRKEFQRMTSELRSGS